MISVHILLLGSSDTSFLARKMHLFPIISLLFIVTTLALIHIPNSFCQDPQFLACRKAHQCGNINFTYPFWGGNGKNSTCGYPGFQVSCQANVPRITIGLVAYRVLSPADTTAGTLTVARDDLWNNTCPRFLQNSTMDFNIFSYSSTTQNLTLFYNCASPPSEVKLTNQFDCSVNGTTSSSFFTTSSNTSNYPSAACNSSIYVPVNQVAAQNLTNTAALRAALAAGFILQYEANNTICNRCRESGGLCGYNNDSNSFICYCVDGAQDQVCNGLREVTAHFSIGYAMILVLGVIISLAGIIIYLLAKRYSWWEAATCWKSNEGFNRLIEEFMRNYGSIAPKLYTYSEIKRMTNSFAVRLGHGGYGCVYRGKLSDGRQVAVKVLNDSKGDGEDFINEVATLSRTSHVNVLTLLGFCYNRDKRALIYEFMPNGSLDKFIVKMGSSEHPTKSHLEWKQLFEIAVGIARGLEYLHRGCNARIVHFDIKPQNILLDADFCPKISDFGLAKLCKKKESIFSTWGARGTVGYIAPEVFCPNFGGMSHKSDVYSYGMMALEMIGLRRKLDIDSQQHSESENYFPNWIYVHLERGKSLPLEDVRNEEEEETARKMILVGLWCIQTNPAHRPSISKVVEMLEGSLQSLQIPPKPFLDSPMAIDFNQEPWSSWSISEMAILNDPS